MFQSPRSGKFVSDFPYLAKKCALNLMFQSPRSGKFVSNITMSNFIEETLEGFNPLDRGNLYQISN